MANHLDRIRFLAEPTRLKIAELCHSDWLTRAEIAVELRRDAGSLSQPRTMVKWGALRERRRRKGSDGRDSVTFRLNPGWRKALEAAKARSAPAWPTPGGDLIVIQLADVAEVCTAIAAGIPEIEWGAQVRGNGGLIIAPTPDGEGASTIRVISALGAVAPRAATLHLGPPMAQADLRDWSARVGEGHDRLPPGS